jgi:uncharacterized protein involved in outer membrane biogenesis
LEGRAMKRYLIILAAVAVVILVVGFAKDIIIKVSVEKGAELVTGLKLNIGGMNVGILKPIVDIKNLKLLNPANFPDRTMVDMPEIYVNYDLPAIISGKIHLPEVRLTLKEFVVVKNADGKLNLDALRPVQAQKEGKAPSQGAPGKAPEIRIDSLKLSIGKVIYKDYSKGGTPDVKEFNINLNESYTNIDNPYTLASLIVVKALMNTSIASLANFDLKGMQGTVGDTLANAQKMASAAKDTAKKAQDTVKQTEDTVKNMLKNPFGSK